MVETNLPVIILKNKILFPYNEVKIDVSKSKEKLLIENACKYNNSHILLINLEDKLEENPSIEDMPSIGVIGLIKSKIELSSGSLRCTIIGLSRVSIINYFENDYKYIESFVTSTEKEKSDELEEKALKRVLFNNLNTYIDTNPRISNTVIGRVSGIDNIDKLTDIIASELDFDYELKLKYLRNTSPMMRMKHLVEDLKSEIETTSLENEIESSISDKIDAKERKYIVHEKIKMLKEELGENSIKDDEIENLSKRIESLDAPQRVKARLNEELKRYMLSSDASPEVTVIRTYIDWLISLPWHITSEKKYKLKEVEEKLNETHYGLANAKNRIAEFITVQEKTNCLNNPIICLVGAPGVGKTSLARSIANALNRKFVKISVGGVSDEAEIIGHRRTYLGANPGKIIQGMKKCGVNNPIFLIDEVDKMLKDYRGDPASALLEVLDQNENHSFCDNYIEEEFDLSKVFFILTANNIDDIPNPLKDRLEIIELPSYTNYDKKEICKKYLIPKLFKDYKIRDYNISINDYAVNKIINEYTHERGVRDLTRKIEAICRKVLYEDIHDTVIKNTNIKDFLGIPKYHHNKNEYDNGFGEINALAHTKYGGELVKISWISYPGVGHIKSTGSIGKIMKESIEVVTSYLRSNCDLYEISNDLFINRDYHVHIDDATMLKDGPSAGVSLGISFLSLLKNKIISNNISMTGEISLHGNILPVGGIKEKIIEAHEKNITKIFIPYENKIDLEEIPDDIKKDIEIILVKNFYDIYTKLFLTK